MQIVVPMAGSSRPFNDAGFAYPKNLVEIHGRPLLEHVLGRLEPLIANGDELICLVQKEENERFYTANTIRLIHEQARVVELPYLESGAVCSVLLAVDLLRDDEPLLIYNGDHIVEEDLAPVIESFERQGLDGGVLVFDGIHPRWSYVRCDENGLVIEAAEKRPISRLASAGTYWFRRASDFVASAQSMILKDAQVDGRFFVCPTYNEMILRQQRIGVHAIQREQYFSLATPQGVASYEEHLAGSGA